MGTGDGLDRVPSTLRTLQALGPPLIDPQTDLAVPREFSREKVRAAQAGRFILMGREWTLVPPIDWRQDPAASKPWRYQLHTLAFLGPLLRQWSEDRSVSALETALGVGLDWIRSNSNDRAEISEFAWYDMAVGIRAGVLSLLLRAAAYEQLVDEPVAGEMVESLAEHGRFLADDDNYAADNNHGLFQDEGLLMLAERLPFLPDAAEWQALAERRLMETLRRTISAVDGVHLEHSPAYHLSIAELARRVVGRSDRPPSELQGLLDRLDDSGPWLVAPDGTVPEVGDSDPIPAPAPTAKAASESSGLRGFLDAGYAAVRAEGSYLLVSAGYHSGYHKHADELSFMLFEAGTRIIGDTGRYGSYESEPARRHARSSHAHNVVVVDGQDFAWRGQSPYGSGLAWADAADGWYGVEGTNPLLGPLGVRHRRLFLYRPALALVVVDEVEGDRPRRHTRLLHFGAKVDVRPADDSIAFSTPRIRGHVSEWSSEPTSRRLVRGQTAPTLQGWTFPADRQWVPVAALELESHASRGLYVTVLSLTDAPASVGVAEATDASMRIKLALDGTELELTGERSPGRLSVVQS